MKSLLENSWAQFWDLKGCVYVKYCDKGFHVPEKKILDEGQPDRVNLKFLASVTDQKSIYNLDYS